MTDSTRVLWYAFTYFYHSDKSNAAFHYADVRFSPITFRLAEELADRPNELRIPMMVELDEVLAHKGLYEEDKGR